MNAESTAAAPASPAPSDPGPNEVYEPMEGPPTLTNTFDTLLKKPGSLLYEMHHNDPRKLLLNLSVTAVACLALFGLMVGFFSGGNQLWAVPLKFVIGVLASGLITLPSLYIFSCLSGLDVNARTIVGVMVAVLCLTALLLLGLAPVAWIFSQSTESVAFMGFLTLSFWIIGLWFGLGLIFRAARMLGVSKPLHLGMWAMIFVVVTLQMSTTLRPLVDESDGPIFTDEKKFFLNHWIDHLNEEGADQDRG